MLNKKKQRKKKRTDFMEPSHETPGQGAAYSRRLVGVGGKMH